VEGTLSRSLRAYWLDRAAQHTQDSYAGVPLSKFPEDLRAYEHLLWLDCPDVVIELGTHYGGAALWLRDRLRALASYGRVSAPRVISVDLDVQTAERSLAAVDPHTPRRSRSWKATCSIGDCPRRWPGSFLKGRDVW